MPAAVVAVAYGLLLWRHLALASFDPATFVLAGLPYTDPAQAPATLPVGPTGYDGQFYYRLALDPFSSSRTVHGIAFDAPAYRYQRIGYPLIVWLLSAGQQSLVPALLIGVNYVGICLVPLLAGRYGVHVGRHAWWGALIGVYPGFIYTITRDLTEIVAVVFLLAGLLALRLRRDVLAGVMLAAAVLTRETTLLVSGAGLLVALACRRRPGATGVRPWRPFAAAVLVYAVWQLVMVALWGVPSVAAGSSTLGAPFRGLGGLVQDVSALSTAIRWIWAAELLLLAGLAIVVAASLRATRAGPVVALAWCLYAAFAVFYSGSVWEGDTAFLRALTEFFVLGALCLMGAPGRGRALVAGGFAGGLSVLWFLVAVVVR